MKNNKGIALIGIIILIITACIMGGGVYYYFSRQTPEAPELAEEKIVEPEEEVITEEVVFPEEEVVTPLEETPPEELKPEIICENECSPTGLKRCSDNNSYQICGNYDADDCLEWSSMANCEINTICQNGNCIQQKCSDGTPYDQCSVDKPKYCANGNLINKCSVCDCSPNQQCKTDENCIVSLCVYNDNYCPWECNNWKLDNDCGVPQIYDFVESRNASDYLGNMIHWDDTDWKNYQPLINKVNEIISGITNDFEEAKAIANWVKHSKTYNVQGTSVANQGGSVIDIFNATEGVCEDAAILTTAMFRIAGFPARAIFPVNAWHAYSEVFVENRWISFDSVFGSGDAFVANPGTSLVYNNEFYKHEPKFVTIFSDGKTYDITNISYYKVNIIQRDIFKNGEAEIKIIWTLNTQESVKEKYCILSSFKTSREEKYDLSPIEKTLTMDDSKYFLNCVVIFESNPYTEHNELITITFTGTKVQIENVISSGYVGIDVETMNIRNTSLGWGSVYIPETNTTLFKNQDNSFSLIYDKANYSDFTKVGWEIKSNNLNCDWYNCTYTNNNNYSQNIQPTGILGYGDLNINGQINRSMPPDHFKGFIKIKLPEGSYKIVYQIPFYGVVAYKLFQVEPNQKIVIYPDELNKESTADIDLFNLVQKSLLSSIEGLNP